MPGELPHFPDLGDWTDREFQAAGYHRLSVSIFDHWLTREEVSHSKVMSWWDAKDARLLAEYDAQDRRFLQFYRELFADGVFRKAGRGRYKSTVAFHPRWDRRLKKDVRNSLRDQGHMEIYVPSLALRVEGGWDRTDMLLFENLAHVTEVEALAAKHGLFVI